MEVVYVVLIQFVWAREKRVSPIGDTRLFLHYAFVVLERILMRINRYVC